MTDYKKKVRRFCRLTNYKNSEQKVLTFEELPFLVLNGKKTQTQNVVGIVDVHYSWII